MNGNKAQLDVNGLCQFKIFFQYTLYTRTRISIYYKIVIFTVGGLCNASIFILITNNIETIIIIVNSRSKNTNKKSNS